MYRVKYSILDTIDMESSTSNPGTFSKECYNKANEAFTNEQYGKAVELYGEALAHDPLNVDYLCARAHALMKTGQFEKAKLDANKAIGTKKIFVFRLYLFHCFIY